MCHRDTDAPVDTKFAKMSFLNNLKRNDCGSNMLCIMLELELGSMVLSTRSFSKFHLKLPKAKMKFMCGSLSIPTQFRVSR